MTGARPIRVPQRSAESVRRHASGRHGIRTDEQGQVGGWLLKLILTVAVVGLIVLEGGAVVVNRLQAGDLASRAATEAGIVYADRGRSVSAAEARAEEIVEREGAEFIDLRVDRQANEISVTVERHARTQVIHRFEVTERFATARTTESVPLRR